MKHINGIDEKTANELKGIKPQYREFSDGEIRDLIDKANEELGRRNVLIFDFMKVFLRIVSEK